MAGTLESLRQGLPQRWLPDETLFSLCSRYHAASGNILSATTCRQLFGHPQQGCAHDFPARLEHFISVAGDALGTVTSIVEGHTVLPLYLRFSSAEMIDTTYSAAALSSSGRLKFQLGLLTSRFRANHPLKACRCCMTEDLQRHFTPYWHREHQLPGVWVCRLHNCRLQASDLKATGVGRFQWLLPSFSQFGPAAEVPPSHNAIQLTHMVGDLVARPGLSLSPLRMGMAFRAELDARGLLGGATRRLRHAVAGEAFAEFLAPLRELEQLGQLPASSSEACAEIARQIAQERSGVHPLRRLALAAWLFSDLDALLARMDEVEAPTRAIVAQTLPLDHATEDHRRARLLELVVAGRTTSAAAREIGIDTTTGMVWAATAGISTPRRPKLLKGDLRSRLIELLRKGVTKGDAAANGQVSVQTVTTLLRTEVGLHEAWRQACYENARQHNRGIWQRITAANPLSGVKAARMAEPAAYAWLYRNDHDWLVERTANMERAIRVPQPRLDWDARDRQLADEVRDVALHIFETKTVRRIKLHQLCQRIPELKAKLLRLDRLPLTRAAIFAVVEQAVDC